MATYYFDPVNGVDANNGLTFANRRKTISSFTYIQGDVVRVIACPRSSLGSCTWTNNSNTVTIPSGLVKKIDYAETSTGWVASTNITLSTSTNYRISTGALGVSISSLFTTGKLCYKDLGSNFDFSAYSGVSCMIRRATGTNMGTMTLNLCSDATGDVVVDSLNIVHGTPTTAIWSAVTKMKGSALGSAIRSISLSCAVDGGASSFTISNIIATKDESASDFLCLGSIIRKDNSTDAEPWYGIRSLDDTTLTLETQYNSNGSANGPGYKGTSQSVATLAYTPLGSTTGTVPFDTGGQQNHIDPDAGYQISGGWNRTDMSTQDAKDYTILDGCQQSTSAYLWSGTTSGSFAWKIEKLGWVRYGGALRNNASGFQSRYLELDDCMILQMNVATGGVLMTGDASFCTLFKPTLLHISCCNTANLILSTNVHVVGGEMHLYYGQLQLTGSIVRDLACTVIGATGSGVAAAVANGCDAEFRSLTSKDNSSFGIFCSGQNAGRVVIKSGTMSGNTSGSLRVGCAELYIQNLTSTDSSLITNIASFNLGRVEWKDYSGTDLHRVQTAFGTIDAQTTIRHTASGIAWQLQPTTTNCSSRTPLVLKLPSALVAASSLVTVKVWLYRTSTSLTGKLVCRGGQITGVSSDVSTSMTAAINTWEEVTITFTPTQAGVVELEVQAYGGTTNSLYVDDMTVSQ